MLRFEIWVDNRRLLQLFNRRVIQSLTCVLNKTGRQALTKLYHRSMKFKEHDTLTEKGWHSRKVYIIPDLKVNLVIISSSPFDSTPEYALNHPKIVP